jgi:hypothetical protein
MRRAAVAALVLAIAIPAWPLAAQEPQAPADPPVSLARIKRALAQTHSVESLDQLRLAYYVSVTADEPQINIFKDFDWKHGPVPGSPPSHQELFQQVTPKEFSAPVADFTSIAAWVGSKIARKKPAS